MITRRDSRDSSCLREIDALLLFRDGVTGMSGHSRPYSTYFRAFSYLSLSSLFLSFSSLHLVSLQKRYKLLFIKNTFGLIYDTVPLLLLQRKEGKESLVSLSQGIVPDSDIYPREFFIESKGLTAWMKNARRN